MLEDNMSNKTQWQVLLFSGCHACYCSRFLVFVIISWNMQAIVSDDANPISGPLQTTEIDSGQELDDVPDTSNSPVKVIAKWEKCTTEPSYGEGRLDI